MNKEKIHNVINKILLKNNLKFKVNKKNLHKNLKELGADSLNLMVVITEVEKEFAISLPDEELIKIKTPNDLIELIYAVTKKLGV